jgi:hypothetical protein
VTVGDRGGKHFEVRGPFSDEPLLNASCVRDRFCTDVAYTPIAAILCRARAHGVVWLTMSECRGLLRLFGDLEIGLLPGKT